VMTIFLIFGTQPQRGQQARIIVKNRNDAVGDLCGLLRGGIPTSPVLLKVQVS
jgi:hypothetical protein